MAAHCGIFAWKILWTKELGRLHSMASQRVGHDLETEKSEIWVSAWSDPGENLPSGWQMALFLLHPYMEEREKTVSSSKGSNPIMRTPPS